MNNVKAKKRFGQHFLKDKNIAEKIVEALQVKEGETVFEIGPGTGILTELLQKSTTGNFFAIEIDKESIEYLRTSYENLQIIDKDILKVDFHHYCDGKIQLIGNLPYNISSQIFFKVLENRQKVERCVFMIQKEVAERISAPPGNKIYGILSVLVKAYFNIEYLFTVKPGVFQPPPKVHSAVIRLTRNDVKALNCDEKLFIKVVKAGFNQRRKTLRNALKQLLPQDFDHEWLNLRAEQLNVYNFVELTRMLNRKDKEKET